MTNKKQSKNGKAAKPKNSVNVYRFPDESEDASVARTLTQPGIRAACTMQTWQTDYEVNTLAETLGKQVAEVTKGNMSHPEAMLMAQAHTLDELFNTLARSARNQSGLQQFETQLRLALKAQTQCRATLETLSNIKNPPVVYAKQANFANNQQVNNGLPASRAGENKIQQNELLTELPNETLDGSGTGQTIEANQAMATLD